MSARTPARRRPRSPAPASPGSAGLSGWARMPSWGSLLVFLALIGLVVILPADAIGEVRPTSTGPRLFYPIAAYILLAIGLNVVVGQAGLLDLGYVAFFAIGAYAMAVSGPSSAGLLGGCFPVADPVGSCWRWPVSSSARPRCACAATTSPS